VCVLPDCPCPSLPLTFYPPLTRNCTYTFVPETGLIERHVVESIEPAPHASFYEGLRMLRLGLSGGEGRGGATAATCPVPAVADRMSHRVGRKDDGDGER
jgi:hypothetical protein